MGRIVAIGGGEISAGETLAIDRAIVELAGKSRPRLLFLPTASGDAEGYAGTVKDIYGSLGCEVEALLLHGPAASRAEIEEKLGRADIVYVGGGNTRMMLETWARLGVDGLLREALGRGALLSGLSAGAVCWFEAALSDSNAFGGGEDWDYCRVPCLGFLRGTITPHYDDRKAEPRFRRFLEGARGSTLALENGAALLVEDGRYRLLRSRPGAGAYRLEGGEGGPKELLLPEEGSLALLG